MSKNKATQEPEEIWFFRYTLRMNIHDVTDKLMIVVKDYAQTLGIELTDDYLSLKTGEEYGECLQAYLKMTGRSQHRGKNSKEHRADFESEMGDFFGMVLIWARHNNIDLEESLKKTWLKHYDRIKSE